MNLPPICIEVIKIGKENPLPSWNLVKNHLLKNINDIDKVAQYNPDLAILKYDINDINVLFEIFSKQWLLCNTQRSMKNTADNKINDNESMI